ncbi:hypothetical protein FOA52_007367 [Chlamydomonas sp. UWO 241]|nr:hypothetical protein FOA52_007367 [Chlamydomonas sp. UWO 241]
MQVSRHAAAARAFPLAVAPRVCPVGTLKPRRITTCRAQWIDARGAVELPVGLELVWDLWNEKQRIPQWMPEIQAVEVDEDAPEVSYWAMGVHALGRPWTFEWTARNLAPVHHQKIHWVSMPAPGQLNNAGAVRFSRRGNNACMVSVDVSFEVPGVLTPFSLLLAPIAHSILSKDMERFKTYSIAYASGATGAHQVAQPGHRTMVRKATPRHPFTKLLKA